MNAVAAKAAKDFNITLGRPNTGSHDRFRRGGDMYPLAAHNGLKSEITDMYIKGFRRCFGLDYEDFPSRP